MSLTAGFRLLVYGKCLLKCVFVCFLFYKNSIKAYLFFHLLFISFRSSIKRLYVYVNNAFLQLFVISVLVRVRPLSSKRSLAAASDRLAARANPANS